MTHWRQAQGMRSDNSINKRATRLESIAQTRRYGHEIEQGQGRTGRQQLHQHANRPSRRYVLQRDPRLYFAELVRCSCRSPPRFLRVTTAVPACLPTPIAVRRILARFAPPPADHNTAMTAVTAVTGTVLTLHPAGRPRICPKGQVQRDFHRPRPTEGLREVLARKWSISGFEP